MTGLRASLRGWPNILNGNRNHYGTQYDHIFSQTPEHKRLNNKQAPLLVDRLYVSRAGKADLFFAHQKALGTNPISFGAPGNDGDAFVMDMATTTVAVGKVTLICFSPKLQRREIKSQNAKLLSLRKTQ